MSSKVVYVEWIGGTIGVVVCEDEFSKERIAYVGQGSGEDEDMDIQHIKDFGFPTPIDMFEDIIKNLKKKE